MGVGGIVFALFTVGYILGVWTAFVIFRQPQGAYEDAGPPARARGHVIHVREADTDHVSLGL